MKECVRKMIIEISFHLIHITKFNNYTQKNFEPTNKLHGLMTDSKVNNSVTNDFNIFVYRIMRKFHTRKLKKLISLVKCSCTVH